MKYLNFDKILPKREKKIQELRHRVDLGDAVKRMAETEGWGVIYAHYKDQLEVYKADMLMGCKDWEDYQDKRAKVQAMNLLLTDIQDFIDQGREAAEEIDRLNAS